MGIVRAFAGAIDGGLADQWQEVIESGDMGDTTVMTPGVRVRRNDRRNGNVKGTDMTVSNGSVIHVHPNQLMMLADGGKIIDYTAEPGYYKVSQSTSPSLFNGDFADSLAEAFGRIKFSGVPSKKQSVYYINLQEIKGIKFGTAIRSITSTTSIMPNCSCGRTEATRSKLRIRSPFLRKRFRVTAAKWTYKILTGNIYPNS